MNTIDVLTLTGKRMRFEIDRSHTLRDLQRAVQDAEGLPSHQQRLVFRDRQLEGGSPILYQIEKIRDLMGEEVRANSLIEIVLILKLIGGGNRIHHRPLDQSSSSDDDDDGQISGRKLTRMKRISIESSSSGQLSDSKFDDDRNRDVPKEPPKPRAPPPKPKEPPKPRAPPPPLPQISQNNGISSTNLALVQYSSETSLSRDRLKKFGFGAKTASPLEGLSITETGSGSEEINESDIGKVKHTIEGGESQVLFNIPHSVTEGIEGKETTALYSEGIDQMILGMYSLQLFRSRMESEKQTVLSEQMPQMEQLIRMVSVTQLALDVSNKEVLGFREERLEMQAEIAKLKKLAQDAGNQGYDRGYERAVKDIEECIANEHPEWDLSFIIRP
ncbi:hypothetical protein Syun_024840 [Stephania yunnanensis]|uniref:Ubiquitin-like domain-containing protein n=1 Tax=Stephania yunnanensis TaxID=152371 RepID=A0AAP0EQI0_9MAGN